MTVEQFLFEGKHSHGAPNLTLNHFSHFNAALVRFLRKRSINNSQDDGAGTVITAISYMSLLALLHKQCHHYY
jgi:hypothetical protein